MTRETLAMPRDDSDSKLMTRDSTRDSALGKSDDSRLDSRLGTCDSGLDSRLDSHDSCTALLTIKLTHKAVLFFNSARVAV